MTVAQHKLQKVMVTGATGYVASWIIKELLEMGVEVNGTVRNLNKQEKYAHLTNLGEELSGSLQLFEADLLEPGSFLEAMQGCDVVIHTASPFMIGGKGDPYKTLIDPALKGTENVLGAVDKTETVNRVVLTSSVVAIYGDNIDLKAVAGGVFTEAHWNTSSSPIHQPYSYSKTVAEKRAWEMAKGQSRWDLVVINPGFVLGPSLTKRKDSASISTMIQMGDGTLKMGVPELNNGVVDVRDIAKAHIEAARRTEVEGRHIMVAKTMSLLEMGKSLRKSFGDGFPFPKGQLPKFMAWIFGPFQGISRKYVARNVGYPINFDNQKSKEKLGIDFIDPHQTLKDHFQQLLDDGMVKKAIA